MLNDPVNVWTTGNVILVITALGTTLTTMGIAIIQAYFTSRQVAQLHSKTQAHITLSSEIADKVTIVHAQTNSHLDRLETQVETLRHEVETLRQAADIAEGLRLGMLLPHIPS